MKTPVDQTKNYPIAILTLGLLTAFFAAGLWGHKLVVREQMQADEKKYMRGLIEQGIHAGTFSAWPDWRGQAIAYEDGWQPHGLLSYRVETYNAVTVSTESMTTYNKHLKESRD